MAIQLGHEALAEAHDFPFALALGVEVAAALCAAHRQGGQAVLEDLFKAQELDDADVDGRMESDAALVGADGGVELDPIAAVDLHLAVVVHPGDTEDDLPFRFHQAFQNAGFHQVGTGFDDRFQALQNLGDSLNEFRFAGITLFYGCQYVQQVCILNIHTSIILFTEIWKACTEASCKKTCDAPSFMQHPIHFIAQFVGNLRLNEIYANAFATNYAQNCKIYSSRELPDCKPFFIDFSGYVLLHNLPPSFFSPFVHFFQRFSTKRPVHGSCTGRFVILHFVPLSMCSLTGRE